MTKIKHWRATKAIDDPRGGYYIRGTTEDGTDYPIAITRAGDEKENAEFIVLSCNLHEELLKAISEIADHTNPDPPDENYRADDPEGCLDAVFQISRGIIAKIEKGRGV